jgi:hypothetical protein
MIGELGFVCSKGFKGSRCSKGYILFRNKLIEPIEHLKPFKQIFFYNATTHSR